MHRQSVVVVLAGYACMVSNRHSTSQLPSRMYNDQGSRFLKCHFGWVNELLG